MSTRQDYITAVGLLVGGKLPLGEAEKIQAIALALGEHSRHRPHVVVEDVDGDGGFDYAVGDLESWSDGFSAVRLVEYPVDDDDENADRLADDAWEIYGKPSGDVLRFLEDTPAATEDFRVTYTATHACTDSACTVRATDDTAVQALAAAHFCQMLAAYYSQSDAPIMGADSVDHSSRSREYAARAKMYRKAYFDHMGIEEGKTPAASVTRDQDTTASWRTDHLTHRRRYR